MKEVYLDALLDPLVLRVVGVILVGDNPLIIGEHSPLLQHTEHLGEALHL